MFFKSHNAPHSRFLLGPMLSLLLASNVSAAEKDSQQIDPAAQHWYQVEVILFDQKTITGSEMAPDEIQIEFPLNWLELRSSYPNIGIMRRPIFDQSSTASIHLPEQVSLEKRLSTLLGINNYQDESFNDGLTLIPEASIPYQLSEVSDIAEIDNEVIFEDLDLNEPEPTVLQTEADLTEFKPVYEQQFQMLNRKYRDLNDTARGLNRRQYRVRFHEAWRFQIGSKEQSPWVLVKTRKEQANRQVIEGSLRFYKSRHLHFESNLWRINFSPTETMEIVLPEIPQNTLNSDVTSLLKALRFSHKLSFIGLDLVGQKDRKINVSDDLVKGVEDTLKGYNMSQIVPLLDSEKDITLTTAEITPTNSYPVKEIWPIKQSKRIQLDEVYYIDHPYMGALVTIKAYEPIPINLPIIDEPTEDLESETTQQ